MRALYASGRQAEALAAYHALRTRLDDELGVEPAAPARELYQRILVARPGARPGRAGRRAGEPAAPGEQLRRPRAGGRARPRGAARPAAGDADRRRRGGEVPARRGGRRPGTGPRFADGAWLCELAALPDGSPVGHAVAAALRIQQRAGLSIEQTVIDYLRGRTLLLVLDNCEHVLASAARLVAEIAAQCPRVVVLATSREALGVDGEQVWPVPPLPVAEDATALFVQRARAVSPGLPARRGRAPARSPRSAPGSTACRWASSWPRPGCG